MNALGWGKADEADTVISMLSTLPIGWMVAVATVLIAGFAWQAATRRASGMALALATGQPSGATAQRSRSRLNSIPGYHGWYAALLTAGPALGLLAVYGLFSKAMREALYQNQMPAAVLALPVEDQALFLADADKIAFGGVPSQTTPALELAASSLQSLQGTLGLTFGLGALMLVGLGFFLSRSQLGQDFRARSAVESVVQGLMILASTIAILTTLGIVLSLLFETLKFFASYSPISFLFGTQWSPQVAIRADQIGQSGAFGALPLFVGTLLITVIAMAIAVPVGLGSAIYLSEYASPRVRAWAKPVLELLAGIPTVVFGFFALLTVAPLIKAGASLFGIDAAAQSALAAGLVMGIMIIPFISSLSDDVINAVPQALRDGSYAMGATKSETIKNVVLPAALPGIVGSVLLAISKALGETMIVTMAAGQNANLSLNPLDMVTTVTVQIVTLLTGDQEYDSPKTHAAFALGFVLFFVTLLLNIIALRVVQKYREKYD
jgi:phosphate transport system permease protein